MPVKRTGGNTSGAPKRTRFASPDPEAGPSKRARSPGSASNDGMDDQFLDADITESNRNAKKRERAALRDEGGYGSDSSNDEESVVPSRRPGAEEGDDDVDMFADEDDAPKDKAADKGKEKKKEFMDLEEIEGQELGRPTGAEDSDSDSEAEKGPKKTGLDGDMGIEITPFNMKKEMEDGRFTADGEEYVENDKDPHEQHDNWLSGTDKDEIKKARRAHRERERLEREREAQETELSSGAGSEEREHKLMRDAVELMERGETVLEALQRLGAEVEAKRRKEEGAGHKKKKSWAERQRERKAAMQIDETDPEHSSPFSRLTEIVSGLDRMGQLDVYSLSREAIQRMLPRDETNAPSAPARPPPDNRAFQYRFSLGYLRSLPEDQRPVEREVFGPFSMLQLRGWKATGFFGPNCENIEVRVVDPAEEQPWGTWETVMEKK